MMTEKNDKEEHPLEQFLPKNARLLMLGTFPPQKKRWSMDFYYPNPQNDMWRIFGDAFFDDKTYFELKNTDKRGFDKGKLVAFLEKTGVALGDTAREVIRTKGNASDAHLQILEPIDLRFVLNKISLCKAIVTTGEKATETLCEVTAAVPPEMGSYTDFEYEGRRLRHYRMPSSSRAYPKPFAEKVEMYRAMFKIEGLI